MIRQLLDADSEYVEAALHVEGFPVMWTFKTPSSKRRKRSYRSAQKRSTPTRTPL